MSFFRTTQSGFQQGGYSMIRGLSAVSAIWYNCGGWVVAVSLAIHSSRRRGKELMLAEKGVVHPVVGGGINARKEVHAQHFQGLVFRLVFLNYISYASDVGSLCLRFPGKRVASVRAMQGLTSALSFAQDRQRKEGDHCGLFP
ncbi:hypothetical protein NDU88_001055 [Pleurodeles waltl]|uniref:Uncharacterized protein n=1 Tax=Pleurodeles waltl TaxID=8319 RepID=A0AAV7RBQ0_PLEWA|nr:hypothetical protein NDU88_001055 [Pleurodeles waltl]